LNGGNSPSGRLSNMNHQNQAPGAAGGQKGGSKWVSAQKQGGWGRGGGGPGSPLWIFRPKKSDKGGRWGGGWKDVFRPIFGSIMERPKPPPPNMTGVGGGFGGGGPGAARKGRERRLEARDLFGARGVGPGHHPRGKTGRTKKKKIQRWLRAAEGGTSGPPEVPEVCQGWPRKQGAKEGDRRRGFFKKKNRTVIARNIAGGARKREVGGDGPWGRAGSRPRHKKAAGKGPQNRGGVRG